MPSFPTSAGMVLALGGMAATPVFAACPMELATYRDTSGIASLEFRPTQESATVTNTFAISAAAFKLDGVVLWSEGEARPFGLVTYQCPEGDVTGAEIEACTVWQGVIYTVDASGSVGLLPAEGAEAPPTLILAGFGPGVRHAPAITQDMLPVAPADVFKLGGCQE